MSPPVESRRFPTVFFVAVIIAGGLPQRGRVGFLRFFCCSVIFAGGLPQWSRVGFLRRAHLEIKHVNIQKTMGAS